MAKRRKAKRTDAQRERLERLWLYYGNYGPQATPGNGSVHVRLLSGS